MTDAATADQIGLMIHDVLNDHIGGCTENEMPVFAHQHENGHPVAGGVIDSVEVDVPEGDYTNILLTLPTGQKFRVQVFAR